MNDLEQILNQWDAAGMETAIAGAINLAQNAPTTLAQILAKYTGTPNGTKFLRDDGSWQVAQTTDAAALTTGTLPLARLSGITTTQLSASAGITSGQIAGVALDKLTAGTGEYLRLGVSGIAANTNSDNGISGRSTGLEYASTTGTSHKWFVAATEYLRMSNGGLLESTKISLGGPLGSSVDGGAGSLALTNRIQFSGAGTADAAKSLIYADGNAGNIYCTVPTSMAVLFNNAGSSILQVNSSGIYLYKSLTFGNVGAASPGNSYIRSDAANVGNLHYDTATAFAHKFEVQNSLRAQIDNNGLTLPVSSTPASASATGTTGQIAWDTSYIYVCTGTNTWKRAAIATW